MPVVTLMALHVDGVDLNRLLERLAEAVADGVGCPAGDVWASFVTADAQAIGPRRGTPTDQCPTVIVRGRARTSAQVAAALTAAAAVVASGLKLPREDIWVQWIDVEVGKVFAGGQVLT